MQLREHSLWLSKREGKDEMFLCSLSNFDAYLITRSHRAPKPFAFAVKSTDSLTFFENAADYLHNFSCNEKEGRIWMEKILVARVCLSWTQRLEFSDILSIFSRMFFIKNDRFCSTPKHQEETQPEVSPALELGSRPPNDSQLPLSFPFLHHTQSPISYLKTAMFSNLVRFFPNSLDSFTPLFAFLSFSFVLCLFKPLYLTTLFRIGFILSFEISLSFFGLLKICASLLSLFLLYLLY
jgi:hypothetical protein